MRSPNWVAFVSILRKEVVRFLRIWSQTLLPPTINQVLYFLIFGTLIGSQIRSINGISYMAFIIPGLIMMAVTNSAFSNVVSSFFGAKFMRNIDELLVAPVPYWVIIAGYVGGGMLRGILVGIIIFIISIIFTAPIISHLGIVIFFIVLTSLLFSLGGLLNAIFAQKFDDVSIFPTFILTPLTYLGGVFYSIQNLPPLFQTISQFNPIFYLVDGFRYGFYNISDVSIFTSITVLLALTIALLLANAYVLKKGIGLQS